jgi:hypothetical protein
MGCDYYIIKVLYVYYNDNTYKSIEVDRDKGYFCFDFDDDDPEYEKKMNEYIEKMLNPHMSPIILYDNYSFKNMSYQNKYKSLIENEISKYYKKWNDIKKIIKVEEREERF